MSDLESLAIKQNNPACIEVIRRVGCFARAAMYIGEEITGIPLTPTQINGIWSWAEDEGFITRGEHLLRESAPLANRVLELAGNPGRVYEVGTFAKGKLTWYPSTPASMRRPDFLIQKIKQGGPEGTHFRNVTRNGKLLWDPHYPEIRVLGIFYSIIYVYVL